MTSRIYDVSKELDHSERAPSLQYVQKHDPAIIAGLCIAAVKKKNYLDASSRCMSVQQWADNCTTNRQLVNLALRVFKHVQEGGLSVPYIDTTDDTILFTWDNDSSKQRRILYIELKVGMSIRYQIAVRPVVGGDHDWKYITDSSSAAQTLTYLAQYMGS